MSILELRKSILAVMMAFAAVAFLPACSSTEEAPPPEESGSTVEDCINQCPEGDIQCRDACATNL